MKKPKEEEVNKKYFNPNNNLTQEAKEANALNLGYNQACDDWEAYHDGFIATLNHAVDNLPSEEEIEEIILDNMNVASEVDCEDLAKALSKRIRDKKSPSD